LENHACSGLRFKVARFANFSGKRSEVQGSTFQENYNRFNVSGSTTEEIGKK
jgi:hypothetical protein